MRLFFGFFFCGRYKYVSLGSVFARLFDSLMLIIEDKMLRRHQPRGGGSGPVCEPGTASRSLCGD